MGLSAYKYKRFKTLRTGTNHNNNVDFFKKSDRAIYVLSRKIIDTGNTSVWKSVVNTLKDPTYIAVTNIAYKLQFGVARDLVIQDEDAKLIIGCAERISKE